MHGTGIQLVNPATHTHTQRKRATTGQRTNPISAFCVIFLRRQNLQVDPDTVEGQRYPWLVVQPFAHAQVLFVRSNGVAVFFEVVLQQREPKERKPLSGPITSTSACCGQQLRVRHFGLEGKTVGTVGEASELQRTGTGTRAQTRFGVRQNHVTHAKENGANVPSLDQRLS